jgi:hypothetical protein
MGDSRKKFEDLENDLYWKSNSTNSGTLRHYPGDIKVKIDEPIIYESPDGGKTVTSRPMNIPSKKDIYVQLVKAKFEQRSQTGIKKYNTTLEREDLDLQEWLNHLQEELMDATLYVERLKTELKK